VRRVIPIVGGTVRGPALNGRVLAGGADYQVLRADGVAEIEALYFIETDAGEKVYVRNPGLAHMTPAALGQLLRGEPLAAADFYFRTTPSFETEAPPLQWLMRSVFVGTAVPFADRVELEWFRLV
jgi:hypothetical protein